MSEIKFVHHVCPDHCHRYEECSKTSRHEPKTQCNICALHKTCETTDFCVYFCPCYCHDDCENKEGHNDTLIIGKLACCSKCKIVRHITREEIKNDE